MEARNTEVHNGVTVPPPARLKVERRSRYGSVPGLRDEELADPGELERQVILKEFEPLLLIPKAKRVNTIRSEIDQDGHVSWGAFGTIDFEMLREELKDAVIMLEIVRDRLPRQVPPLLLRYLRLGWIEEEDIRNEDMRACLKWHRKAQRILGEIHRIRDRQRTHEGSP
jgi:hypothetical protein